MMFHSIGLPLLSHWAQVLDQVLDSHRDCLDILQWLRPLYHLLLLHFQEYSILLVLNPRAEVQVQGTQLSSC